MFRSRVWQAILDAKRQAEDEAVVIEELAPVSGGSRWEARLVEPRSALLARAAVGGGRLRALLPPSPPSSPPPPAPPVVALLLPRSADYLAAALAALATGAAFLPLELQGGGDRGAERAAAVAVARAAGAQVLVVPESLVALVGEDPPPLRVVSVRELFSPPAKEEEQDDADRVAERRAPPTPPPAPKAPALPPLPYYCLMPTSGSTASAKIVRLTEEGLLRRCRWALEGKSGEKEDDDDGHGAHPPSPPLLRSGDAVAFTTSPAFVDHLAQQVFAPLLFAGRSGEGPAGQPPLRLVVVREEDGGPGPAPLPLLARPKALVAALNHCRATHCVTVPSVLAAIVACGLSLPPSLRCLISSGEPLAVALAEALLSLPLSSSPAPSPLRRHRLLNLYGSTETSGDAAWLDVGWWLLRRRHQAAAAAPAAAAVPAGLPLDKGVALKLRRPAEDDDDKCGEVLVGGWCVAAGYHGVTGEEDGVFWTEEEEGGGERGTQQRQARLCRRWFATGDRGRFLVGEGDGGKHDAALLHIEGRVLDGNDSFAKVAGGARVDCAAVEAALSVASGGGGGIGPVAVRAWPLLPDDGRGSSSSFLAAYVESADQQEDDNPRLLAPSDPLRRALESAADAAGLPPRARPSAYLAVRALPRSAGAGKLLRGALPQPPLPDTTTQPVTEGAVLDAFRAALEAVGDGGGPPLEPAEDALQRAGGGAASRVAVAVAAALGVPPPLVFAFPSARLLARALSSREQQKGQKRARDEENEEQGKAEAAATPDDANDDRPFWPPADEAWSVPLHMCVDASPVVVGGADVAAAASHGGELACWPLKPPPRGGSSTDDDVSRGRFPGSLDAGLAAIVGPSLVAVVCRGGDESDPSNGSTLHLAPVCARLTSAPSMPPPLALGAHVSSPPAVLSRGGDHDHHHVLFLATHAPNPRLVVVRVSSSSSGTASIEGSVAAVAVAVAPLSAPSAATPLVLPGTAAVTARAVVATLDGSLVAFDFVDDEEAPATLRQVWRSTMMTTGASPSTAPPIFGAPVSLPSGDVVVAAHVDGSVRAARSRDGAAAWEAALGAVVFARLAVVVGNEAGVVVAATEEGVLYGLEGSSGRRLWRVELRGGRGVGDAGVCSPLAVALPGRGAFGLVVAAHDGRLFGLRFADGEQREPAVISEQHVPAATYGAPVLVGVEGAETEDEAAAATRAGAGAAAASTPITVLVLIGCRDDRVRAVRMRL